MVVISSTGCSIQSLQDDVCVLLVRAHLITLIPDHSDHASTDSSFGNAIFQSVKWYDFTLQQERQETRDSRV
jgi:hypothetical protein